MAVRSHYTRGTTRKERPVRKVHTLDVEFHPKIKDSDLKRFLRWYYDHMSPEEPLPTDIKRILREVSKVSESQKKRFFTDENFILPSRTLKQAPALREPKKSSKPTGKRVVKIVRRRA